MSIVGFDFGTTNSLISVIRNKRPINFLDDQGLPFPSVVCYEGAKTIVGRAAKERLSEAGLGIKGNVIRSPKMLLGHESIFVEGVQRSPVDVVTDVAKYVKEQSLSSRGRDLEEIQGAVVTIPVDMEGYRRAALRDAFRSADINIVQFIHEPLAALYGFFRSENDLATVLRQYNRKVILVFDWGGGTLDLTLCRLIDGLLVQVMNDGTDEVGGDVFDELIKNEIVQRVCKARRIDDTVQFQPDALTRLMHRCESAKIDLSTRNTIELYVANFFRGISDQDLHYSLSRTELEEITAPLLNKGLFRIGRLLEAAGVSPAEIAVCLATGGMANMPAIRARLHEWFGAQRLHVPERSGTLIAEGAAWIAHDNVKLRLAKNVELLLARNSYATLIKAGTIMPGEGDISTEKFHLYCADPRDGFAKCQLYSPVRPGPSILANDRRSSLENLILKVDSKARPFQERLELDIQIDDNLILQAQARSLNKKDIAEAKVHNLEFGLSFPSEDPILKEPEVPVEALERPALHEPGNLVMRSNVTQDANNALIPGELLYSYDPGYFDVRRNPPGNQVLERLYYRPCSACGRASNDPLCKCASQV